MIALVLMGASPADSGTEVHSTASLDEIYGADRLAAIRTAKQVYGYRLFPSVSEKFRRSQNKPIPAGVDGGTPRIAGNLVTAEAGQLDARLMEDFRAVLTDPTLGEEPGGTPLCGGFQPGIALRFVGKSGETTVLLCFVCEQFEAAGHFPWNMPGHSLPLLRLSARLFPGDADLADLLAERTRRLELERRYEETFTPAVARRLEGRDFIGGIVRILRAGADAGTATPEVEREADELLTTLGRERAPTAVLTGLGTTGYWGSEGARDVVLVALARRLGEAAMVRAFEKSRGDEFIAAGLLRLLVWFGFENAVNLPADRDALVRVALDHCPRQDCGATLEWLADRGWPGLVDAYLSRATRARGRGGIDDEPSLSALAALSAARAGASVAQLEKLGYDTADDRLALAVALVFAGKPAPVPVEALVSPNRLLASTALAIVTRSSGRRGLGGLCASFDSTSFWHLNERLMALRAIAGKAAKELDVLDAPRPTKHFLEARNARVEAAKAWCHTPQALKLIAGGDPLDAGR